MQKFIAAFALITLTCALAAEHPAGGVTPKFAQALPNVAGKSMIAVEVKLAPGEITKPHRHAKSAFIYAYVLEGIVRSQLEGEPAKTYHVGESWFENPGAHHVLAQNLSKTKTAKLLAIFVVDSSDKDLTTFD
jgi:quercetin dioxygenase-like cupin family protein